MSILTIALRVGQRQQPRSFHKTINVHAKPPLWILAMIVAVVSFVALTAGTITATSIQAIPSTFELPQEYLPGASLPPIPKDVECSTDYVYEVCPVSYLDKEVYLYFQQGTRMITSTSIRVHEYTIGDLIAKWGTPTGMTQYAPLINVYWGKRSAVLYANSFRPDNTVTSIAYEFDAPQTSPWRGFTNSKH